MKDEEEGGSAEEWNMKKAQRQERDESGMRGRRVNDRKVEDEEQKDKREAV